MGDLERALAFLRIADRGSARAEPFRFGTAVFNERLPRRWDSNYLLVERLPADVDAEELAQEADRVQGAAGLLHRKLEIDDEATAARLEPGFRRLGWRVQRELVMAHRRPADRTTDLTLVELVDEADLREVRLQTYRSWESETETIRQLLDAKRELARVVETRFLAVREDGRIVSYADLYWKGGVAQIEDVATVEAFRSRGYATAVVLRALAEARKAENDLTFLLAHEDDWPKQLYRKLGFDEIGRLYEFVLPAAAA